MLERFSLKPHEHIRDTCYVLLLSTLEATLFDTQLGKYSTRRRSSAHFPPNTLMTFVTAVVGVFIAINSCSIHTVVPSKTFELYVTAAVVEL